MPQIIPFIVNYAATAFLGNTLLTTLLTFASAAIVGNAQRRKAQRKARDAFNASLQDRTQMLALVQGARSRVYGRARNVDGVIFKGTWGADKRYYTLVVAVAGHEVDAIEDVYFNELKVTLDGSGYVQTAPYLITSRESASETFNVVAGSGSITLAHAPVAGTVSVVLTSGQGDSLEYHDLAFGLAGSDVTVSGSAWDGQAAVYYQWDHAQSFARVRKYLGTAAQDLSSLLTPNFPDVTSADKFAGIALLLVDLEYSQDVYPSGVPQISAVVKGAKILDTRTSTTAWTQNPAVIARDWALYAYGGGCSSGQFDDTAQQAAANVCDADSTFNTTGGGSVVMDTYQCGIVIPLDGRPDEAMEEIVESMAGRWGWAGGKLRFVAGGYRAPVATITEDWIADGGSIEVVSGPPRSDLVNSYRVTIADREADYVVQPMPTLAPSSYVASDGQELTREIEMRGVTRREHALHIAGVLLRDARQGLTAQLPCNMRAFKLELFDTVEVTLPTFGWSAKVFEVLHWQWSLGSAVGLHLKETTASIYTPDASFDAYASDDNTALPVPTDVPQITGLAISSSIPSFTDDQAVVRTLIQWDLATDINVLQSGWVEVQYLQLGLSEVPVTWQNNTPVGITWQNNDLDPLPWVSQQQASAAGGSWNVLRVRGDQTSHVISGVLRAEGLYLFRVRAEATVGVRSNWSKQVLHAVPPAPVVGGAPGSVIEIIDLPIVEGPVTLSTIA